MINAIITAAGSAKRFFHLPKMILPVPDKPLIQYLVESVEPFVDRIIVVVSEYTVVPIFKVLKNHNVIYVQQKTPEFLGAIYDASKVVGDEDTNIVIMSDNYIEADFSTFLLRYDAMKSAILIGTKMVPRKEIHQYCVLHERDNKWYEKPSIDFFDKELGFEDYIVYAGPFVTTTDILREINQFDNIAKFFNAFSWEICMWKGKWFDIGDSRRYYSCLNYLLTKYSHKKLEKEET